MFQVGAVAKQLSITVFLLALEPFDTYIAPLHTSYLKLDSNILVNTFAVCD